MLILLRCALLTEVSICVIRTQECTEELPLADATVTNADIRAQYSGQEWSDIEEAYGPYDRDVPSLAFRLKMQQVGHRP